jgi:vacuolar-type H+-ATPase subunit I/STV1
MIAGLVAGVVAFVFARVFGAGPVNAAIAFEEARASAEPAGEHTHEMVTRATQMNMGLAVGVGVYALAFGGLFALAFAVARGRLGRLSARATALSLALVGYLVAFVVPFLKYPGNPPAVGNPATIGERTGTFFAMVLISIAVAVGAAVLGRRLAPRRGSWTAGIGAVAVYVVVIGVVAAVLPGVQEVPDGFPALTVWDFRIASLGLQLVMWLTIGLVFGALVDRRAFADPRPAVPA